MGLQNIMDHKHELMEIIYNWYMHPFEQRQNFAADRFFISRYDDLVKDLEAHLRNIYATFKISLNAEFEIKLKEESMRSRGYVSRNTYSLEQFGLDRKEVIATYRPVFDALNFDIPEPVDSQAA